MVYDQWLAETYKGNIHQVCKTEVRGSGWGVSVLPIDQGTSGHTE